MSRLIAFHLPQFHPIPENDQWWGKGFTEWTNVTKARPNCKNHYQPQLPQDLGFYDLRLEESRIAQAELAKQYGIYGFCYYHYWFQGKRLLERPLDEIVQSGNPDFPFMLCWANENWTRRWDGGDNIVLMEQKYSKEDAYSHIQALLPYFKDSRYIKINGKPFFLIYRSTASPEMEAYLKVFHEVTRKEGIELYIGRVESLYESGLELQKDYEVAVEFQPFSPLFKQYRKSGSGYFFHNIIRKRLIKWAFRIFGQNEPAHFWKADYESYVDFVLKNYQFATQYKRFPGLMPSWDNTARRGKAALGFFNSTPEKFADWLNFLNQNFKPFSQEEDFIFINAWNEWAEGAHLEPCTKWGRQYLEKVKEMNS